MDQLKHKIFNLLHPNHIQEILEKNEKSIFQSNAIYIYKKQIKIYHYNVPKHDGKKLYVEYNDFLNDSSQENAQKIIDQLKLTNINIFNEGGVKEEAIHIPGPGLCWVPVALEGYVNVLLINAEIVNDKIIVTNWKLININEHIISIKSCETLLINNVSITKKPRINFIIGCPLEINVNNNITYLG